MLRVYPNKRSRRFVLLNRYSVYLADGQIWFIRYDTDDDAEIENARQCLDGGQGYILKNGQLLRKFS